MSETASQGSAPAAPLLVQSPEQLNGFLASLGGATLIGFDTEAASFHRYQDRVFLIQVSSRSATAVIDPLAVSDLSPLGEVLARPEIEVVFHDADYDLRILDRDFGFRAANIFDTRIAAQLLNEPGVGLAALLDKYFGVRLDKRFQRADWSQRPLSAGMLDYAAADTRHLPALRDLLRQRLLDLGRLSWAEEEFRLLERVRWSPPGPAEEAFLRVKGARTLRGPALAILREVFAWREETARRLDRATFRVLGNESLLALANTAPRDLNALAGIPGLSRDLIVRRGNEILAAVERGLSAPRDTIPALERTPRTARDPELEALVERMKTLRNQEAERIGLAPGVLCPNGTLEAIARARPISLEEMTQVPEVRKWQVVVLGERLLGAMAPV